MIVKCKYFKSVLIFYNSRASHLYSFVLKLRVDEHILCSG